MLCIKELRAQKPGEHLFTELDNSGINLKKTLSPLFMDRVQPSEGCTATLFVELRPSWWAYSVSKNLLQLFVKLLKLILP